MQFSFFFECTTRSFPSHPAYKPGSRHLFLTPKIDKNMLDSSDSEVMESAMKRSSILSFLVVLLLCCAGHASEVREIEMTDGSIIAGELISLANGMYTISRTAWELSGSRRRRSVQCGRKRGEPPRGAGRCSRPARRQVFRKR